ncbi:tyrosine-type recombinase/integrase [Tissierella praeacuta]|uniref:tyrosine-type recombinase/integrase n=1 Tax=Tissierella praeacuta TaxID=43131 RepID=UPI002FDABDC5
MEQILDDFKNYMIKNQKSQNTIKNYVLHIKEYMIWFQDTYGKGFKNLYRENILDYKSYLVNVKKYRGKNLNAKTINAKLSSIGLFNKFLIEEKIQKDIVVKDDDMIKIQTSYANPAEINKLDVENFRQKILEAGDKRLYAIVTLLSYAGLRISEALNLKLEDLSLGAKELIIRKGKGEKQRIVYLNSKIINSIREYLKVRNSESEYLFSSRESDRVDRSVINKQFKKYSNKITPHQLRHFFCTNALESGFAVHEVANLAGHSSIQTTLIYTNPSREKMKSRIEML